MIKQRTGIDSYIAPDTRTRAEVMREDEKLTSMCAVHCTAVIRCLRPVAAVEATDEIPIRFKLSE